MSFTVKLIRHGETALQAERRYQGSTDAPLSAECRGKLLAAPVDRAPARVFVSPLRRARETASILFPSARQVVVPDFREMDFGVFEGRSAAEMEHDPVYRDWVGGMCRGQCPGGESKDGFAARVCAAFEELMDGILTERKRSAGTGEAGRTEETIVIVAHGGTQMVLMERYCADSRAYYEWQRACGQGWILAAEDWETEKRLRIAGETDHRRKE